MVDSAYGDAFTVYRPFTSPHSAMSPSPSLPPSSPSAPTSPSDLVPYFDGSASWWTQGIGYAHPALTLTPSNAAGRYGHISPLGPRPHPRQTLPNACSPATELAQGGNHGCFPRTTGARAWKSVGVDDSSALTGWVAQRQSAPLECGKSRVRSLVWPFFSLDRKSTRLNSSHVD